MLTANSNCWYWMLTERLRLWRCCSTVSNIALVGSGTLPWCWNRSCAKEPEPHNHNLLLLHLFSLAQASKQNRSYPACCCAAWSAPRTAWGSAGQPSGHRTCISAPCTSAQEETRDRTSARRWTPETRHRWRCPNFRNRYRIRGARIFFIEILFSKLL